MYIGKTGEDRGRSQAAEKERFFPKLQIVYKCVSKFFHSLYGLIIKPYKPITKNPNAIIISAISNLMNALTKEDIQ